MNSIKEAIQNMFGNAQKDKTQEPINPEVEIKSEKDSLSLANPDSNNRPNLLIIAKPIHRTSLND